MSRFVRLSALGPFAAAGVGIAVRVAASTRTDGDEPRALAAKANLPDEDYSGVTQQPAARDDIRSSASLDVPRMVPPRQIPADRAIAADTDYRARAGTSGIGGPRRGAGVTIRST
jgi:hypothetical protein